MLLAGGFMVQMAWRRPAHLLWLARVLGHGLVAFPSTAPFFAAEVWFKFREVIQKWQHKGRNVPLAKQRTAPLSVSWSSCLKPSLVQEGLARQKARREDQAWSVRASLAGSLLGVPACSI